MDRFYFSFTYSPLFIPLCLVIGLIYAYLLYSNKHVWSRLINNILFAFRACIVSFMVFIIIGPTLQLTVEEHEKPSLVVLIDNSVSMRETLDLAEWQNTYRQLKQVINNIENQGFDVPIRTLDDNPDIALNFNYASSDINGAVQHIIGEYEGKNLTGIAVISDGIYNSGISPLYNPTRVPIYTVGMGDPLQRIDASIKNTIHNKIVYQDNSFPLLVESLVVGIHDQDIRVSVYQNGKQIATQKKNTGTMSLVQFSFEIEAREKGLQRLDIVIDSLPQEKNIKNNSTSVYIDVVKGKKKILMISPAPHPDNKAMCAVVAANTNYELSIYIPDIETIPLVWKGAKKPDVVIFRYTANENNIMNLLDSIKQHAIPLFIMLGGDIRLQQWKEHGIPLSFERLPKRTEVLPVVNMRYKNFNIPDRLAPIFYQYPPANTFFGKIQYPPNADVLLFQRVGEAEENRPLLLTVPYNDQIIAVLLGEGVWRWRMNEFAKSGSTEGFDILFSKLIRYLGTRENKQRFRSFPVQNEFTIAEPVVFESQVYNSFFELVYGYPITLELTDEHAKVSSYQYVVGPNRLRYTLGELEEGVYSYRASTMLDGKNKVVRGKLRVTAQNIELQNLMADFPLLQEWARRTGGVFYDIADIDMLATDFKHKKAIDMLHSETLFNPLIDLKWLFVLLLLLISIEWGIRKFLGGY